jgi:hypothetical protein
VKLDWKQVVGTVAPTIATALGGPLAGMAVKAIATSILGKPEASEDEVAAAVLAGDPALLLQLKQCEADFNKALVDAGVQIEKIAAEDRTSARRREVDAHDSWTPRILAATVIGGFLGCVYSVLAGHVQGMHEPLVAGLVGTLIGYTSAKADQVISYYFGSSASSKAKDQTISDIAKMD